MVNSTDIDDNAIRNVIRTWLATFMARTNPALGRSGAVCPFVPSALSEDTIQILNFPTAITEEALSMTATEQAQALLERIKSFPESRPLHVSILAFPSADTAIIDSVQDRLKELFVSQGLMIGEFHPKHSGPGLHNPNFQPMRAPVPMLVLREMVRQDLVFLSDRRRYSDERIQRLTASYNQMFPERRVTPRSSEEAPL